MTLLVCAAVTAALTVASLAFDSPAFSRRVLDHIGVVIPLLVSTGGIGAFLFRVDRSERNGLRCDRMLTHLLALPHSKAKEKAIIDLANKMALRESGK